MPISSLWEKSQSNNGIDDVAVVPAAAGDGGSKLNHIRAGILLAVSVRPTFWRCAYSPRNGQGPGHHGQALLGPLWAGELRQAPQNPALEIVC